MSVRLPAVLIDALADQLPPDFPSVNAWVSAALHALIDVQELSADDRLRWQLTADPQARAGRK